MKDLNRRSALGALAGGSIAVAAGSTFAHQDVVTGETESSGATQAHETVSTHALDVSKLDVIQTQGLGCFFGRISPDASPGWNTLTITGLPAGTRSITVWMTEWVPPNNPHAGGAFYTTSSVQLYDNGRKCRVRFHLSWSRHLPTAAQVMFCRR